MGRFDKSERTLRAVICFLVQEASAGIAPSNISADLKDFLIDLLDTAASLWEGELGIPEYSETEFREALAVALEGFGGEVTTDEQIEQRLAGLYRIRDRNAEQMRESVARYEAEFAWRRDIARFVASDGE